MSIKKISAIFLLLSLGITTEALAGRWSAGRFGSDKEAIEKRSQYRQSKPLSRPVKAPRATERGMRAPIHKRPERAHVNKKGLPSNVHAARRGMGSPHALRRSRVPSKYGYLARKRGSCFARKRAASSRRTVRGYPRKIR